MDIRTKNKTLVMTFIEIFDKFKNNSYIRRESWSKNIYVQLRNTATLIRLVLFEHGKTPNTLNNDIRLTAKDLLADDWVDIDSVIDIDTQDSKKFKTLWEFIDTLPKESEKWYSAINFGILYKRDGKNPDEYIEEIINKVNKA